MKGTFPLCQGGGGEELWNVRAATSGAEQGAPVAWLCLCSDEDELHGHVPATEHES